MDKFDHHCQWINNCVGKDNHKVFYLYILSLAIYFVYLDYICITNYSKKLTIEELERQGQNGGLHENNEFYTSFHLSSIYGPDNLKKA